MRGPALRFNIPIYEGTPKTIYTRVDHGIVEGKAGSANSISEQKYRALHNLVEAARAKGANAVIEAVGEPTNEGYLYTGRAVSFDDYPPESSEPAAGPASR